MKTVMVQFREDELCQIDEAARRYASRSEFIREAIREKMRRPKA